MKMEMHLSQSMLRFQCEAPYLTSTFPAVDRLLNETDSQRALEFVGRTKNMSRYFDMIDFLFCEIFIKYRNACFKYYRGEGPKLKDMITEEERQNFERVLVRALEIATIRYQKREYVFWTKFRSQVLAEAA